MVQKSKLENNGYYKIGSPKLIFFNEEKSNNFWHRKSTLKVWFWHFLTNRNSLADFFFQFFSFEFVDSLPKILIFRTHHLWSCRTELINHESGGVTLKHAKMMHKGQGIPVASHRDNYFIRVVQSSDSLWKQKRATVFWRKQKKGNSFYL